jgi:hypothetical protein
LQVLRTDRQLYCTQADLVYAPNDQVSPYNRQFFAAGANKGLDGTVALNQADLKHLTALDAVAPLNKVTTAAGADVVTNHDAADLQVIDSQASLGSFFKAGPL